MKRTFVILLFASLLILVACSQEPDPTATAELPTAAPQVIEEPADTPEPAEEPAVEEPAVEEPAEEPAAEEAVAEPAMAGPSDLTGIRWHWEAFQDTAEVNDYAVPNPTQYQILFNDDGTAEIKADCNAVGATYTADGSSLTITTGPATAAFCGEESLDTVYLNLLGQVASYVISDGNLYLNLIADAGNMVFGRGPLGISPEQISLDTQGLPYSWQAVVVPTSPYDQSQPPGPMGIPEHIEILFGLENPSDWDQSFPIMYIIPVNAYREQWDANGNDSVSQTIENIQWTTYILTSPPPTSGMPALPSEAGVVGTNDLAVQVGRPLPFGEINETSAAQSGYRFDGRWEQSPNPVTNQNMRYVSQGFTNDGVYLVSFFWPTTTSALPSDSSEVPADVMEQFSGEFNAESYDAYLTAEAERLNSLESSAWDPDLATLDAVLASLQIEGMVDSGLLDKTWVWTGFSSTSTRDSEVQSVEDPTLYQVNYQRDGTVHVVADCNVANFPYELRATGMVGGMLAQPGPVTLAQCAPESRSDQFIGNIQATQDYRLRAGGDQLELILPAGGGSLFLVDLDTFDDNVTPPEPETGEPTATVIAPLGANGRLGPGTDYPILGTVPAGTSGRVVGRNTDSSWWAVYVPGAPNDQAWVAASTVATENVDNVPVIPAPPPPAAPTATPTPVPTAAPPSSDITFTASRTTINAGETATLAWSVENVSAVYMFPVGGNYQNYPVTGQGSRDVKPGITTTYTLLVFNTDGSTSSESIEITVINGLTANRWVLQSYSSAQTGSRTPIAGTQITASFEANGNLSGSGGCNTYNGGFTAYDEVLRVSSLGVTQAFCESPEGTMDQESVYLSLLQQAARFSISAGQLSVFDNNGNRILVYING